MLQGLRQDPVADARGQTRVLDQRQELHRCDQSLLRVFPPDQGLEAEHLGRAHIDLGLVVEDELLLVQRFLDAANGHHPLLGAAAVLGVEEEVGVAASLLGAVHRMVGMAQQRVGVAVIDRVDRGAHAGRDLHGLLRRVDRIGQRDHAQHPLDRQLRLVERARTQQQHELVATQACGGIGPLLAAAQRAAQAAGKLRQQSVAGSVTIAVIHGLEAVQVEVADDQQVTIAIGRPHRIVQQLRQPRAVG